MSDAAWVAAAVSCVSTLIAVASIIQQGRQRERRAIRLRQTQEVEKHLSPETLELLRTKAAPADEVISLKH